MNNLENPKSALLFTSLLPQFVVPGRGAVLAFLLLGLVYCTSSFIATYVLSMAAAMRLLRPPLRYAAAVSLAACVVVLSFAGALLVWIAGVAACSLGYQWLLARPAECVGRLPAEVKR